MNIEIIDKPLSLNLYGFSGIALNKDYAGTAFRLMDKMWQVVKANGLKNKGLNVWIYEPGKKIFAGIELVDIAGKNTELERKTLQLSKYAYYRHVGPYSLVKQSAQIMKDKIEKKGFKTNLPYIEIYGHWTNDESKLETEILMCLK